MTIPISIFSKNKIDRDNYAYILQLPKTKNISNEVYHALWSIKGAAKEWWYKTGKYIK